MQIPQPVIKGPSGKSDLTQRRGSFLILLSMALMLATFAITRSAVAEVVYLDNSINGEDSYYYMTSISGSNALLASYYDDSGILILTSYGITISDPSAIDEYDELLNPGTTPLGISGSTVVGAYLNKYYVTCGFIYKSGAFTTVNNPNGTGGDTYLCGVDGTNMVGFYFVNTTVNGNKETVCHGFLLSGTTYTTLDDPLATGATSLLPGYPDLPEDESGYSWAGAYATGISGTNIVGFYVGGDNHYHGFLLSGTTWTTISNPDADPANQGIDTYCTGVSGSNIVGYSQETLPYIKGNPLTNKSGGLIATGFFISGTTFTSITDPSAGILSSGNGSPLEEYTTAMGVSGSNVVGYCVDQDGLYLNYLATITSGTGSGSPVGIPGVQTSYTLTLTATDSGIPQGIGYGTLTISRKDGFILAGALPDGESIPVSGKLADEIGVTAVNISKALAYPSVTVKNAKGSLAGTLFIETSGSNNIGGALTWTKPAQKKGTYPAAIQTDPNISGWVYTAPGKGGSVLPGFTTGAVVLSDTTGFSLTKDVTLTAKNGVTVTNPGADKLSLTITAASGLFKGSFRYPFGKSSKSATIEGVLDQSGTSGFGLFLGPNGTGQVSISQ
jgi:hypothetical protein